MLVVLTEVASAVVALVGLLLLWSKPSGVAGRIRPGAILLAWCVVSLLAEQVTFMMTAHLAWKASAAWGVLLGCAAPAFALLLVPGRRGRAALAWLLVTATTALIIVDRLYFAWFGDVFPAVAWLSVRQVGTIAGVARDWVTALDVWNAVEILLVVPLLVAEWRDPDRTPAGWRPYAIAVAAVVAAVSGWQTAAAIRAEPAIVTQRFSNLSLVERIGPFPFHALDSWLLVRRRVTGELVSDADFEEVLDWLKQRAPMRAGTGPWRASSSTATSW